MIGRKEVAVEGAGPAAVQPPPQMSVRAEVLAAEKKVAKGVEALFKMSREQKDFKYDPEGSVSIHFSVQKLGELLKQSAPEVKKSFINNLNNGVTVHFISAEHIPYPPIRYLVQQKVHSLCEAAAEQELESAGLNFDENSQKVIAEIKEVEKKRDKILGLELAKMVKQYRESKETEAKKIIIFHQQAKALMEESATQTLQALYYLFAAKNTPIDANGKALLLSAKLLKFEEFAKNVIEKTSHYRSDTHDILTFNEKTKSFSYDEAANVTAHDRGLGRGCSNLSAVFEGTYKDAAFSVNSSYVKHASLAPIDAISSSLHLLAKEDDPEVLADTCLNAIDVIKKMAAIRQLGQPAPDEKDNKKEKNVNINWVYQLLTTNMFNDEKQTTSYGYMVQAMLLLNGGTVLLPNDKTATVQTSVLNAGINQLADVNSHAYKENTQRRENRRAYFQLSDSLKDLKVESLDLPEKNDSEKLSAALAFLKSALTPPAIPSKAGNKDINAAYTALSDVEKKLAKNANEFIAELAKYEKCVKELKTQLPENATAAEIKKHNDSMKVKKVALNDSKTKITRYDKVAVNLGDELRKYTSIVLKKHRLIWWNLHKVEIKKRVEEVRALLHKYHDVLDARLKVPATSEATAQQLLDITALIYKSYTDELFYSDKDKYRDKDKAAAFNAYVASYQRVVGMMTSIGCKSANDRTYVLRLLIAALANQLLSADALPIACHTLDNDNVLTQDKILGRFAAEIFSNAAIFACANDTSGGSPKVDAHKFAFLCKVLYLDFISAFGDYAPHKMKKKEMLKVFAANVDVAGSQLFQAAQRPRGVVAALADPLLPPAVLLGDAKAPPAAGIVVPSPVASKKH